MTRPKSSAGHAREKAVEDQPLILVVDDFDDARMLYAENLRAAGYRVAEAPNGRAALALTLELEPDVIVTDLSMPVMDGWEAVRRIRAEEGGRHVHIVVLTAMASEESRNLAYDAGADDFVSKPLLPEALVALVRSRILKDD